MAFKLKRKGEILGINEDLSSYNHPVFEKELESHVIAEANRDGTTFVNKNASPAQKRDAIAHENIHHDQMLEGRLQYTDDTVIWKKDTKSPSRVYKRMNGHLMSMDSPATKQMEGSPALEWEDEANKKS
jgi:hypothetical protein